jgi:hypothetical protein
LKRDDSKPAPHRYSPPNKPQQQHANLSLKPALQTDLSKDDLVFRKVALIEISKTA